MNNKLKDTDNNLEPKKRRVFNYKDGILVLSLLIAALILSGILKSRPSSDGRVCYVLYEGNTIMTVPLDTEHTFSVEQLPQVEFEVRNGRIAFTRSNCPDQVCVHTGFIGEHGQFAACLPNGIVIRIEQSGNINAPDAIAQ